MWAECVYQEIVPPERIVFINSFSNQAGEITRHPIVPTWPRETQVMVKLEDDPGDKTRLNVRWTPHNAAEVEQKRSTSPMSACRRPRASRSISLPLIWHGRPSTYSAPDSDDVAFRRIDLRVQSGPVGSMKAGVRQAR